MRSAHITRRQAEGTFSELDADVTAVQEAAALAFERAKLDVSAELDAMAESIEIELTADEQAALHDFLHDFTDQRAASRTTRRARRELLRSNVLIGGLPSQGKTAAVRLAILTGVPFEGEAA
jgi:hypothetical protein